MNELIEKFYYFLINIGNSFYQSVIYDNRYKYIIEGLINTVIIAFFAVIIGIIIGIIIALIRNNHDQTGKMKIGNTLAKSYVNIIRGTPVILQLMIIYYVIFHNVLWFRIGLIVNCLICIIIDILSLKNSSNQLSEKTRVRETILLFVVVIIWTIIKIVKSINY